MPLLAGTHRPQHPAGACGWCPRAPARRCTGGRQWHPTAARWWWQRQRDRLRRAARSRGWGPGPAGTLLEDKHPRAWGPGEATSDNHCSASAARQVPPAWMKRDLRAENPSMAEPSSEGARPLLNSRSQSSPRQCFCGSPAYTQHTRDNTESPQHPATSACAQTGPT